MEIQNLPWVMWLFVGLSPGILEFDPRPVYVGFVVDKVGLGQSFLRVLRFSLSVSFHRRAIRTSIAI